RGERARRSHRQSRCPSDAALHAERFEHLNIYIPGKTGRMWSGLNYGAPRDSRGDLFGDVQALVFLNGHLVNLDYCRPQHRDALVAYQEAFNRAKE
ncbi:MAG: hypothetical protein OEN01_11600, partial [Candidatus Krumholzibacteria bacterium]|nr:hypothetical protein [Candidatus Krumholzibacteria bacterium]